MQKTWISDAGGAGHYALTTKGQTPSRSGDFEVFRRRAGVRPRFVKIYETSTAGTFHVPAGAAALLCLSALILAERRDLARAAALG